MELKKVLVFSVQCNSVLRVCCVLALSNVFRWSCQSPVPWDSEGSQVDYLAKQAEKHAAALFTCACLSMGGGCKSKCTQPPHTAAFIRGGQQDKTYPQKADQHVLRGVHAPRAQVRPCTWLPQQSHAAWIHNIIKHRDTQPRRTHLPSVLLLPRGRCSLLRGTKTRRTVATGGRLHKRAPPAPPSGMRVCERDAELHACCCARYRGTRTCRPPAAPACRHNHHEASHNTKCTLTC